MSKNNKTTSSFSPAVRIVSLIMSILVASSVLVFIGTFLVNLFS